MYDVSVRLGSKFGMALTVPVRPNLSYYNLNISFNA